MLRAPVGGISSDQEAIGFAGVGAAPNEDYAKTIPHVVFAIFQMMFAIITPALITGAFAERKRFKAFVIFMWWFRGESSACKTCQDLSRKLFS